MDREKAVKNGQGTNAYILEIQATELDLQNAAAEELDWEPISNEQNSVKTEITIMIQDINDERKCLIIFSKFVNYIFLLMYL